MVDPQHYCDTYLRALAQRGAQVAGEVARIRAVLPAAASLLRARYGARRVGFFGSLATGSFHEKSDVDLYVDSITGSYFDALADLSELLGRDVDLIELNRAPPSLAQRIAEDAHDIA